MLQIILDFFQKTFVCKKLYSRYHSPATPVLQFDWYIANKQLADEIDSKNIHHDVGRNALGEFFTLAHKMWHGCVMMLMV